MSLLEPNPMYVVTQKGKIVGKYGVPYLWKDKDSAGLYLKAILKMRGAIKQVKLTLLTPVVKSERFPSNRSRLHGRSK